MYRIYQIATMGLGLLLFTQCNNSGKKIEKLEGAKQEASYAQGAMLGEQLSRVNESFPVGDSLSLDDMKKGYFDYLNSMSGKSKSYIIGSQIGMQVVNSQLSMDSMDVIDKDAYMAGVLDAYNLDSLLIAKQDLQTKMQDYFTPIQTKSQAKQMKIADERFEYNKKKNQEAGTKFLEANKKKQGVKTTASGLQYVVLQKGDGVNFPDLSKDSTLYVKVDYTGTKVNGEQFETSGGNPRDFMLRNMIEGWKEGIPLMSKGSKYKFFIPANLAYGEDNKSLGPNQTLIFEVELIDFYSESEKPAQPQGQQQFQLSPEQMRQLQQAQGG